MPRPALKPRSGIAGAAQPATDLGLERQISEVNFRFLEWGVVNLGGPQIPRYKLNF